ncbi:uncharacterized protein LOC134615275 isoform X2 [Pelobates fuscus]
MKIRDNDYHELKKSDGKTGFVAIYHGSTQLHQDYENRGLLKSGFFLLKKLMKEDSGVYSYYVNNKIQVETRLIVLDPVEKPVLQKTEEVGNDKCQIVLQCMASIENLNVTFWKSGLQIENVNLSVNSTSLYLNGSDPRTSGRYSCQLSNPISHRMSDEVHVTDIGQCKIPGSKFGYVLPMMMIVLGILGLSGFLLWRICVYLKSRKKPMKNFLNNLVHEHNLSNDVGVSSAESPFLPTESPPVLSNTGDSMVNNGGAHEVIPLDDLGEIGQRSAGDTMVNVRGPHEVIHLDGLGEIGQRSAGDTMVNVRGPHEVIPLDYLGEIGQRSAGDTMVNERGPHEVIPLDDLGETGQRSAGDTMVNVRGAHEVIPLDDLGEIGQRSAGDTMVNDRGPHEVIPLDDLGEIGQRSAGDPVANG